MVDFHFKMKRLYKHCTCAIYVGVFVYLDTYYLSLICSVYLGDYGGPSGQLKCFLRFPGDDAEESRAAGFGRNGRRSFSLHVPLTASL